MRHALKLHPDSRCAAASSIHVDVERTGSLLALHYVATGKLAEVALPAPKSSGRADELWRHTCFEAFVRAEGEERYLEFNFSPSTQWAAYEFDAYRDGMRPLAQIGTPHITVDRGATVDGLGLYVELHLGLVLPVNRAWQAALSAVIEERDGAKSYWALAHPRGKPDFHDPNCFILDLAASEAA
jgi:hypothetical protein